MNSVVGSVRRGEEGVERTTGLVGVEREDRGEGSAGEEIGEGSGAGDAAGAGAAASDGAKGVGYGWVLGTGECWVRVDV